MQSPLRLSLALTLTALSPLGCGSDDADATGGTTAGSTGATGSTATGGAGGSGGQGGSGGSMQVDILDQLQSIPGVLDVVEGTSNISGYRFFQIDFDQPADHDNPAGQHFTQRLVLHHRDTTAPFVLASTGYYLWLPWQYLEEPAELLGANQLVVEHRYFNPSRPNPADWTLDNIQQAAADHHRIVQAFRPIYSAKWVSTGVSKGGMTSVYHRRFYPDDVDGTVAYVAPHSGVIDDPRYISFIDQVGTDPACRQALKDFQRETMLRKPAMLMRMNDLGIMNGVTFDLIGLEPSFESTIAGFAFAFWQYQSQSRCADIPPPSATDDQIWAFLDDVGLPIYGSDPYVLGFEPYFWQAYTQLGTPGIDTAHIADLLVYDWKMIDDLPSISLTPMFDPAAMQDVTTWLTTQGQHIMFIYGETDPWSAGAFNLGAAQDAYKLVVPGGNHGAGIVDLAGSDQQAALSALQSWTGVTPALPKVLPPRPLAPPMRLFRRSVAP